MVNLKIYITKVTGVSFWTPKDYVLRNLKIYILRLDINQILKMGFQLRYK